MNTIKIDSLDKIEEAAKHFISLMGSNKVFAFYGEMGAGKTTFIKTICKKLGVTENITSPTFSLVNEYITINNDIIYHFDCYRLKDEQEAFDIGAEEYLYSNNICFIEWPHKIEDLIPDESIKVEIKVLSDNCREINVYKTSC